MFIEGFGKLDEDTAATMSSRHKFQLDENFYRAKRLRKIPAEDARQHLPIGTEYHIVISANLREWRHIMKMRSTRFAHWEIRRLQVQLLTELKKYIPVMFEDFVLADDLVKEVPYYEQITKEAA